MKFFITRERIWGDLFEVRIAQRVSDKSWALAHPLKMEVLSEQATESPIAFSLTKDSAQALIDELWNVGIRPTEGTGSAGSLAATQKHLEDMRALVFKTNPK